MDVNAELKKIEDYLSGLSEEELDDVLFDCGIESIKPSIDSDYVKCLHKDLPIMSYRKALCEYNVEDEYFDVEIIKPEVA